jgi:hypothetical protein
VLRRKSASTGQDERRRSRLHLAARLPQERMHPDADVSAGRRLIGRHMFDGFVVWEIK